MVNRKSKKVGIFVVIILVSATLSLYVAQQLMENSTEKSNIKVWVIHPTKKIFMNIDSKEKLYTEPRENKTYNLTMAKNSIDFFQLVISAIEYDIENIRVFADNPKDENGFETNNISISLYYEYFVKVRTRTEYESVLNYELGYYPDALPPLTSSFKVSKGKNQPIWVEIKVSNDTKPGRYFGSITVEGEINGKKVRGKVNYNIEVLNYHLPDHSGLLNPAYADFWILEEDNSLTDQEYFELVRLYTEFFVRRDLNVAWSFDVGEIPAKDFTGDWDFSLWLEDIRKILDSGVLELYETPVLRVPIDLETLGYGLENAHTHEAQTEYMKFLRQFREYVMNQNIAQLKEAIWIITISEFDEPNTEKMAELISLYYNLTQDINMETSAFNYFFEVEGTIDWYSPAVQHEMGSQVKNWTNITRSFDYWMAPQEDIEFDVQFIRQTISDRKKVIIYQQAWTAIGKNSEEIPPGAENRNYEFPSLPGIVNPALYHRILPWIAWVYNATGIGFWAVMNWYNPINDTILDMWAADPALWIAFRETVQGQNGDGWLIYPGYKTSKHTPMMDTQQPVSSIRLELFRKGLEDYKYIKLLQKRDPANPLLQEIKNTVRTITNFDKNPEKYDQIINNIKHQLGDITSNTNPAENHKNANKHKISVKIKEDQIEQDANIKNNDATYKMKPKSEQIEKLTQVKAIHNSKKQNKKKIGGPARIRTADRRVSHSPLKA